MEDTCRSNEASFATLYVTMPHALQCVTYTASVTRRAGGQLNPAVPRTACRRMLQRLEAFGKCAAPRARGPRPYPADTRAVVTWSHCLPLLPRVTTAVLRCLESRCGRKCDCSLEMRGARSRISPAACSLVLDLLAARTRIST
eukprot:4050789-Pleurochrysis_carterae.AAC.2